MTVPEIQEEAEQMRLPYAVCLLNIQGGLNISTAIRSSHNLNAGKIFVFGRSKFDRRGMVGSQNYSDISKVPGLVDIETLNVEAFINLLGQEYYPVFIETGGVDIREKNWHDEITQMQQLQARQPMFIFGTENEGIPEEFLELEPIFPGASIVSIPMGGVQRSFNVSCAVSIVLYDVVTNMNWL